MIITPPLKKTISIIVQVMDPDRIILFGSCARGNNKRESGYDLLVLKHGIKKQRELSHKIYVSFKNIGAPVDVIVANLERYEQLKDDPYLIYSEAAKYGKIVYERPRKGKCLVKEGKK